MKSQRIHRSLEASRRGASARGFTLIELMVTITILGILLAIAVGGWRKLERDNAVEGAIEQVRSAMSAARIKAQASGKTVYVAVDFGGDRMISTVLGNTYNASTGAWTGSWSVFKGVDVLGATAACAPAATTGVRLYAFKPSGTVGVSGGGGTTSLMVKAPATNKSKCLVVNTITGRVRVTP